MRMDFTVNVETFTRELGMAIGAVERRALTVPALSHVLLDARDGALRIIATDLDIAIRTRCAAHVAQPGSCAVLGHKLLDYVRLLPGDMDARIVRNNSERAEVVCGGARARIPSLDAEEYPELPSMPEEDVEIPADVLATMINRTQFAIPPTKSLIMSRFYGLLRIVPRKAVMVATDGHRLAYVEAPLSVDSVPERLREILFPKRAAVELLRLCREAMVGETVKVVLTDNHLFLAVAGREMLCRAVEDKFPEFERVLPARAKYTAIIDREHLMIAIERALQFSDRERRFVRMELMPGELHIIGADQDAGESEEVIECAYRGEEFMFGINGGYVLDFLRAAKCTEVELHGNDARSAVEFRPTQDGDGWVYRYIVMPMRL
jgi:DNA polymerase-3 subunit beta